MKRAIVLFGLLLALGGSLAGPVAAADTAPATVERLQALDQAILVRLNTSRAAHGLRPLVVSTDLEEAAVAHSRAMLEQGFFAHDSPSGAPFVARVRSFYRSQGYDSWSVGENLLYNTAEISAEIAISAWLASPAHRKNMLTPEWREVGIGSLHAQAAGGMFGGGPTWVITMDFGARSGKAAQQKATTKPTAKPRSRSTGASKPSRRPMSGGARSGQRVKPQKPVNKKAMPARKKGKKARGIDRVLPTPAHDPNGDAQDPAAGPIGNDDDDLGIRRSGHHDDDDANDAADETNDVDPPL